MKLRLVNSGLGRSAARIALIGAAFALNTPPARAALEYGNLALSGSLETQNLFRMRRPGDFQPVQQRNMLHLGLDARLVDGGKLVPELSPGGFGIPWLRKARLFLLYRGVYDSVYDWAPGGNLYNLDGQPVGSLNGLSGDARRSLRFPENDLREAYTDIEFAAIPLSLRLGKQQIAWGETDNFRILDRVNALDLTWHLQQEIEVRNGWERLRVPYWMIKWNLRLPETGPVADAFLEGFWNPGDWVPAKRGFLPEYPWSISFANPFAAFFPNGLANGTKLFRQGDYSRNPAENSQVGVRLGGYAGGVSFTLAYLWQRWAGDDGTDAAVISALLDPAKAAAAVAERRLPAEFIAPRVNTFGFSATYPEERFTEAVLKTEMAIVSGVPFQNGDQPSPILPGLLFHAATRDMWQAMVGFDRPARLHWLNPEASWLLLGQFFWHYLIDNSRSIGDQTGLVGNLSPAMPLVVRGTGERCVDPRVQPCEAVDKVRDWEALLTLTATSFYLRGKLAPQITYILDPVNSYNMEVFWGVDYFVTAGFVANVGQRYFVNTTSDPVYEPWGVGGFNRGRSETQVRLTWEF